MSSNVTNPLGRFVSSFDPYDKDTLTARDGLEPFEIQESRLKRRTASYFVVALFAFAAWASFAPLDAGVHVSGSVVVQGNRKAVQHPSGGVVQEIFTREGAEVKRGDTLIRINPLTVQAALNRAELEYINALCEESRLLAERSMADEITWLSSLELESDEVKVTEAKWLQSQLFNSRRNELINKIQILEEQTSSFEQQAIEMEGVLGIKKDQLKLLSEDAENNAKLAAEGYVPRSRANEIERERSDLMASIATTATEISKIKSNVTSSRLQISQERSTFFREVDDLLRQAQQRRKESSAELEALKFDLSLTDLRAPVDGTVVGLSVFTVGGVIKDGEVLMEIVPNEERLIIDAKVPTNLIDKVHVGLDADIRFTAFSLATTPVVTGQVRLVGADKRVNNGEDANAPDEFYVTKVETSEEGLQLLGDKKIQPGMPVDVIIKTGERTFLTYVLKPLIDRFAVSFKED